MFQPHLVSRFICFVTVHYSDKTSMLKIFYSDTIKINLPENHIFPIVKYAQLRNRLLEENILFETELVPAPMAGSEELQRAHSLEYVNSIKNGNVSPRIMRQIGLPWSRELYERAAASTGGTVSASIFALESGFSGNLAGGTHHAFPDEGRGFCVFNDVSTAVLNLLQKNKIKKAAVLDLDAHQGNGNSAILGRKDGVYILSIHSQNAYPVRKVPSTFDIGLPDYCEDTPYLEAVKKALNKLKAFSPEILFYIAGVDPLKGDRFGKMSISMKGLAERDKMVFEFTKVNQLPLVMVMGGGYSNPVSRTVDAHLQTYRIVKEFYR